MPDIRVLSSSPPLASAIPFRCKVLTPRFRSVDLRPSHDVDTAAQEEPTDISRVPDVLLVDPADDTLTPQADIMREIISNSIFDPSKEDRFFRLRPRDLPLSRLKSFYKNKDLNVLSILANRHRVQIDDEFTLKKGVGKIFMDTSSSLIDFFLTVGNRIGFSPLLPNARSDPRFCLHMDLHMQYKDFKTKNAMLGFDPAGRMLFLGRCRNEDVYLAMAPKEFFQDNFVPTKAGYSTGPSTMSTRHYRQVVMMLAHFLAKVSALSFFNVVEVYRQSLDSPKPHFSRVTDVL